MEKTLKQRMSEFLDETIQYYTEDTGRRCTSSGGCFYNPRKAGKLGKSLGCAIGRKMTSSQKRYAPDRVISSIDTKFIPKELKDFPIDFLIAVQSLHDNGMNWGENCLRDKGTRMVQNIRERFGLDNKLKTGKLRI